MKAVILFAHGARDPAWAAPFEATAKQLQARAQDAGTNLHVRNAYLEFMQPSLPVAGTELAEAGCTDVTVVPMFLGAGGHVRKDLPLLVEQLAARFPGVAWHLSPALGETPQLIQAMADTAWLLSQPDN